MKKKTFIFLKYFSPVIILTVLVSYYFSAADSRYFLIGKEEVPGSIVEKIEREIESGTEAVREKITQKEPQAIIDSSAKELPRKFLIKVPFTSQAPLLNWDAFHEEACEEASIIMVKYYLDGKTLDKETAEKEIQSVIAYELKKYGDYKDNSAEQMVEIARNHYGVLKLKVVYDFKKDDIKKYLATGRPIILPAAGRILGNPYYTQPGPIYHVLVLTGYDGDKIITNDPGTKRGEGYRYNIDVLFDATHDFPGDLDRMETGRKAMIVMG